VRRIVAALIAVVVIAGALYLGFALLAGTTTGACPTALLEGALVEQDGTLAVRSVADGEISTVQWPFGYGVGEEDGTLTLTRVFMTVAREGDLVSMGGGVPADDSVFVACGSVALGLAIPPQPPASDPGAKLTVTGTAYELVFEVEAFSDGGPPHPRRFAYGGGRLDLPAGESCVCPTTA
jgi:hypothetical protein